MRWCKLYTKYTEDKANQKSRQNEQKQNSSNSSSQDENTVSRRISIIVIWLPVYYRIQFKIAILTYKTLATCQPSYLYNLLQLHQPSRALRSSTQQLLHKYHICLLISVGVPSATALLQHGIPFLPPSKIVCPYFNPHIKSHLIAQLISKITLRLATWWLSHASVSYIMHDYARIINFCTYYCVHQFGILSASCSCAVL